MRLNQFRKKKILYKILKKEFFKTTMQFTWSKNCRTFCERKVINLNNGIKNFDTIYI